MDRNEAKALLDWYLQAGVDEIIEETPINRFKTSEALPQAIETKQAKPAASAPQMYAPQRQTAASFAPQISPSEAIHKARQLAESAQSLEQLKKNIEVFDGCPLKKTATQMVFSDGNPQAKLMLVGEAPGAEEDKQGIPFCGASGQLLDRILAAIGYTREHVFITNTVYWRPPGNRQPTNEEFAMCLPFLEKTIALIQPKMLVLVGGTASKALLETKTGITRLRGKEYTYTNIYLQNLEIPARVVFHPSYLLRQPGKKKEIWFDFLTLSHEYEALV
jgi:DNA polymerase